MRWSPLMILLLALAIVGCNRPRFVAPSSGSIELATHNGFLWTIPGNPLMQDGTLGPQQNLLHLLVVCPDLAANERGTGTGYEDRVNSYVSRWGTSKGPVAIAVDWDKHADTITVGGQTFGRGTGNVFVVKQKRGGALSVTQLASAPPQVGAEGALRYIQSQMTNDIIISSIGLPQRD